MLAILVDKGELRSPKKKQMLGFAQKCFALCESDKGVALDLRAFEKARAKLLIVFGKFVS
ncbi:hypothetical protein DW115_06095 [Clostridium sp. AM09-51]|nr:hypothetical protein DW115_06095 [Clostridium sp. AM09-51]